MNSGASAEQRVGARPTTVLVTTHAVDAHEGVEVRLSGGTVRELARAALEARKAHPRARLFVAGAAKLVRELERRYPPLVDVAVAAGSREAIEEALGRL
jgi:hypothetical protein